MRPGEGGTFAPSHPEQVQVLKEAKGPRILLGIKP